MALKIAVNNNIELFLQKQAQDTKKSLGWKKNLHFISLSFTVHKRTQCHIKGVKNLDIYFSACPDLISALKRTTLLT